MLPKKTFSADLEHNRILFFELSLIAAMTVSLIAFEWNFRSDSADNPFAISLNKGVDIDELVPVTKSDPVQPDVKIPPLLSEEIKIVSNKISLNNDFNLSSEDNPASAVDFRQIVLKPAVEEITESDEPFITVEKMPTFGKGGLEAFQKYVLSNVKYSQNAIDNGVFGTVIVEFVVGKTGSVEDVKILRSIDSALDNEVVRVLRNAPHWIPGYQRSTPVRVKFTLPVSFRLNQ